MIRVRVRVRIRVGVRVKVRVRVRARIRAVRLDLVVPHLTPLLMLRAHWL